MSSSTISRGSSLGRGTSSFCARRFCQRLTPRLCVCRLSACANTSTLASWAWVWAGSFVHRERGSPPIPTCATPQLTALARCSSASCAFLNMRSGQSTQPWGKVAGGQKGDASTSSILRSKSGSQSAAQSGPLQQTHHPRRRNHRQTPSRRRIQQARHPPRPRPTQGLRRQLRSHNVVFQLEP